MIASLNQLTHGHSSPNTRYAHSYACKLKKWYDTDLFSVSRPTVYQALTHNKMPHNR